MNIDTFREVIEYQKMKAWHNMNICVSPVGVILEIEVKFHHTFRHKDDVDFLNQEVKILTDDLFSRYPEIQLVTDDSMVNEHRYDQPFGECKHFSLTRQFYVLFLEDV